jgi:hypothetical protein
MTDTREPAWQGDLAHLYMERRKAREQQRLGLTLPAASMRLSAYITAIGNVRSGAIGFRGLRRAGALAWWGLLAERNAQQLKEGLEELTANQLNVLAAWLIKTAQLVPFRYETAASVAERGLQAVKHDPDALPHQQALAHIAYAQALAIGLQSSDYAERTRVMEQVKRALSFEKDIRAEPDQPQGLRQFVRVLKAAGELKVQFGKKDDALAYFMRASALAEGEARTESQAAQLRVLIQSLE